MTSVCSECGNEIPDDMDFCPQCGCLKSKSFTLSEGGVLSYRTCPNCGAELGEGDQFCGSCGARIQAAHVPAKMRKYGMLALALAVIPGFFNIFGLGHLVMRNWSRGIMFLIISAVLWYLSPFGFGDNFVVMILSIMVFFYQAMDILNIIYRPEEK